MLASLDAHDDLHSGMKRENKITVILGKKGYGKTSYTVAQTRELKRLIIFDYNREYEAGKVITHPKELIAQLRLNMDSFFRLIFRPDPNIDIDLHFDFFSTICFKVQNYTVVFEEIDLVSKAGVMPLGLKQIINYGRHQAINVLALSRRAHMVPRDLTANADAIVTFNQQEPRDIKYLTDYMGQAGEKVRDLKKTDTFSEFLEWENGQVRMGKINFVDKRISYN